MSKHENAQDLCHWLADHYDARLTDRRAQALAATLREIGEVLGPEPSADALLSFWGYGLMAGAVPGAPIVPVLARKATLGHMLSIAGGVPRQIDTEGASLVGDALVTHYQALEGPRAAAMAATFKRELAAVRY